MAKYSMGIDFGTLSGRAVIADIETGNEIATSVCEYAHGIMSEEIPCGKKLPKDYALQHPKDYLDVLYFITNDCIKKSNINPSDIIGVGVDFTAATLLPVTEDGTPLCFMDEFKENPHAYVKLWKHHAAQKEADEINALAKAEGEEWLGQYGGIISSEWQFPKILEILREDENLYNHTARFTEAGDWIVRVLTGAACQSVCTTGFKGMWNEKSGYPSKEFFKKLDPKLENIVGTKISADINLLSQTAGYITKEASEKTGIPEGTPVAPAIIDAHAAIPALGITKPGELLMIIGTSTCHILLGDKAINIPGISGYVKDGIIDGLYAYEAGQASVGDSFEWFVSNCIPQSYSLEAEEKNVNIHTLLRQKAKLLPPGSNGLIALDWFNGNRTPYVNGSLKGMISGLNLGTKPEEIYRALIEATAYGTRRIIEIYEENGIVIKRLYATGGIAEKDEMLMQIYADVTGKEIFLSDTAFGCAYGSAVLGSVNQNGYGTIFEAAEKMKKIKDFSYKPNTENKKAYDKVYAEYKELSEYFARK